MKWKDDYQRKLVSPEQAVAGIKSGDRIAMGGGVSAPPDIVNALCKRYEELTDVTLVSGITMYMLDVFRPEVRGHINFYTLFMGPLERMHLKNKGNVEPISYHLSLSDQIVMRVNPNVYFCEVSPPDKRGYMSLGPIGVYNGGLASQIADTVIVQVNKETPFVNGVQALIHVSDVDLIVEKDHPLTELPEIPISEEDKSIGALIAERVPDGATIQLGIGGTSNAVGHLLKEKKDLGVHTEMLTESVMDLVECGAVNGKKKTFHPGKIVCGFCIGSKKLYDFIDNNPICEFAPIYYTNDVNNIAKNNAMVSINNTMTVDLTGQCASESLGHAMYSGTGGQVDFVRGAALSKGGMSFIALPSTSETKSGRISRVVSQFLPGTIVTTPRADVRYIVTENGVADLWLKSVPERVREMLKIAHPDFRDQLKSEAEQAGLLF
jgi:4-hydroxybutyrate CoA-transferase